VAHRQPVGRLQPVARRQLAAHRQPAGRQEPAVGLGAAVRRQSGVGAEPVALWPLEHQEAAAAAQSVDHREPAVRRRVGHRGPAGHRLVGHRGAAVRRLVGHRGLAAHRRSAEHRRPAAGLQAAARAARSTPGAPSVLGAASWRLAAASWSAERPADCLQAAALRVLSQSEPGALQPRAELRRVQPVARRTRPARPRRAAAAAPVALRGPSPRATRGSLCSRLPCSRFAFAESARELTKAELKRGWHRRPQAAVRQPRTGHSGVLALLGGPQ